MRDLRNFLFKWPVHDFAVLLSEKQGGEWIAYNSIAHITDLITGVETRLNLGLGSSAQFFPRSASFRRGERGKRRDHSEGGGREARRERGREEEEGQTSQREREEESGKEGEAGAIQRFVWVGDYLLIVQNPGEPCGGLSFFFRRRYCRKVWRSHRGHAAARAHATAVYAVAL